MRAKITLSYNGTHFLGLQIQKETSNTIMGEMQRVLQCLGIDSKIVASGRTDKAVHALGQVCHIDLPPFWDDVVKLKRVFNEKLPKSIHIKNISLVHESFHARYSAKVRTYRYIIKKVRVIPLRQTLLPLSKR
ncbi:MAG: hypothetical protein Q9M40_12010 [Sulfurimonas sp.]|nr:hypothetical protein [Sulfurimonas sp.]